MADSSILIAGNICAGKTTLVNYMKERRLDIEENLGQEVTIYPELIDQVSRENFYEDQDNYTFGFELYCLTLRMSRYAKAKSNSGIFIFDRGMIEGAEVFAKNSYQAGPFKHDEHELYQKVLHKALDNLKRARSPEWLEKLIVYLRVEDPKELKRRNIIRAQEQDVEEIPLSYLTSINQRYEDFIANVDKIYRGKYAVPTPKVLTIDASVNMRDDQEYLDSVLGQIVDRVKEMQGNS